MDELTNLDDLEASLNESEDRPIFLFKHSTVCPISAGAFQSVREFLEGAPSDGPPFHLVKVIESRPISSEIAARLGVQHQSPQLILVKNRKALWEASHHGIRAAAIEEALEAHT